MLTRKSIDTVLLSVGAEKLSQREWDWMKMLKPMDPPPAMVAASILERRGDTAALTRLQDTGVNPSSCCPLLLPAAETSVHGQPVLDILPGCGRSARYRG